MNRNKKKYSIRSGNAKGGNFCGGCDSFSQSFVIFQKKKKNNKQNPSNISKKKKRKVFIFLKGKIKYEFVWIMWLRKQQETLHPFHIMFQHSKWFTIQCFLRLCYSKHQWRTSFVCRARNENFPKTGYIINP